MKRLLSKTFIVAAVAVLFSAFGAVPAGAGSVGGAVLTGTITPDPVQKAASLPPTVPPTFFAVSTSQSGPAVGVIGTTPANCTVTLNTTGTTNLVTGSGSGNLGCNGNYATGGSFSVTCNVTYQQVGGAITVSGGCSGTPAAGSSLTATCGIEVATTTIVTECAFAITPIP